MSDENPPWKVGDHFTMKGPTVPRDLWEKYWIVLGIEPNGTVRLSPPYLDQACTKRYHPVRPQRV